MKIIEDPNDKRIYILRTKELFEHEAVYQAQVAEKNKESDRVLELHAEGKSYRDIEEITGVSKSKVGNIVKSNSS
ncbi:hypothetical protein [Gracilimonas sediminicola]|uniref:Homeodomain-like domain-containing protein n=1 Tax=Gracilimonas sediminicola TaxID=2952158 RepID=A0A9X2L3D6_9BACT|nr:hypothetical protein [Gracilimonas sediminicola]MCP9291615.1 hypothetical protein [Gracilimonas sediminicola]